MKHFLLLSISILCTMLMNSCTQKLGEYKIYPLSPYSDAIQIKNKPAAGQEFLPEIKTEYYVIDESTDLTDKTRIRLENFISTHLKKEIAINKAIYFAFYKGGFTFGRKSVQTKEQLHNEHAKDKLAEFEYKNGKLYNFDFYKDGTYYTDAAQAERGHNLNAKEDQTGSNEGGQ